MKDVILLKFSKECNVESIWFKFLYKLNEIDPLETHETLFILNFLLNLTTNGDYYIRIESKLFCKILPKATLNSQSQSQMTRFSFYPSSLQKMSKNKSENYTDDTFLLNRIDHYDRNKDLNALFEHYLLKFSSKTQKLKIRIIWFLDVFIRILFEIVSDNKIKKLFLYILQDFIKISDYNLVFLSNDAISIKLMLYLRCEEDHEIRRKISAILVNILKNNSKVSHIRVLTSILKFPMNAEEIMKAANNFLVFEDKELLKVKFQDANLLADSLKELSVLMTNIVEFTKSNTIQKEALYFSGNSSGIILKNFNSFPANNFSIICQIKFENLMTFEKKFGASESYSENKSLKSEGNLIDLDLKSSFNFIKPHSKPRFSEMRKNVEKEKSKFEMKYFDDENDEYPDIQKMSNLSKESYQYKPMIFSMISSSDSYLDIYLEDSDSKTVYKMNSSKKIKLKPKKILKIRLLKKQKLFEEIFMFEFEEEIWYDLVISYKNNAKMKNNKAFEVFLNGTEIPQKTNGESLSEIIEDFKSLNLFTIGCKAPDFLKNKNFSSEEKNVLAECFCGEMKNLLILDIALNFDGSKNGMKKMNEEINMIGENQTANEKTKTNFYASKNVIMSLDDFSILADIKMGFDFMWFEIKNKNEIKFLELEKIPEERTDSVEVPKLKKNIFTKFFEMISPKKNLTRKNKNYNDFKIFTKEVTLIEKSTFFEILFTLGNVEVLLYVFEIILSKEYKDTETK